MKRTESITSEERLRLACQELDRRIRQGEQIRAEQMFALDRSLAEDESVALDLIYAEIFARDAIGQLPTCEEYVVRFPHWEVALRRQFAIHELAVAGRFQDEQAAGKSESFSSFHPRENSKSLVDGARIVGNYELLEAADQGGAGIVYRARHRQLGHIVALKMLSTLQYSSFRQRQRFKNEAAMIASLNHRNIVRMYEIGETEEGAPFLVLEWVKGGSLSRLLSDELPKSQWIAQLLETVARAVDVVHQQGIVHRDLSPSNILLDENQEPRVADFGLAILMGDAVQATRTGDFQGTPSYTAPEQIESPRKVDLRVDVYALGGILYAFLTGRPPFLGETLIETLQSVVQDEPVPPERLRPQVPADLSTICLKCLQKRPEHRYASAAALADDLQRFRNGEPIHARRAGMLERTWKWIQRNPTVAALAVPAVVAPLMLLIGSFQYVVNLRQANAIAEQQRALASRHSQQIEQQLAISRRTVYAQQLTQANALWKMDPGRALNLLDDPERCPPDLRDFTWRLFDGLCRREMARRDGYQGSVMQTFFMPGGKSILSGTSQGEVQIWNWQDEQPGFKTICDLGTEVRALDVSPDGKWIAAAGIVPGSFRVFSFDGTTQLPQPVEHQQPILSAAFSPDGTWLVTASKDQVCLRNFLKGTIDQHIELNGYEKVGFSPDGQILALVGTASRLVLWNMADKKIEQVFKTTSPGTRTRFSTDGLTMGIVEGFDGVEIFHVPDGTKIRSVAVPQVKISDAAFLADGSTLLTVGSDKMIREWDYRTGRELSAIAAHGDDIWAMDLDAEDRFLVTGSGDRTVKVWDRESYRANPACVIQDVQKPLSLATSADGQQLAMGGEDGHLWISNWSDPTKWTKLGAQGKVITKVLFSPDGREIFSADVEGDVVVWDLAAGKVARVLQIVDHTEPRAAILEMALSPDGNVLVTAPQQGIVCLWNLADGTHVIEKIGENVWSMDFSTDGRQLVLGTELGSIWVMQLLKNERKRVVDALGQQRQFPSNGIVDLAFSPGDMYCATATRGGLVTLWNTQNWIPVHELRGHSSSVQSVIFSPEQSTLITGSGMIWENAPGEVKFWDTRSGHNLATFPRFSGPLMLSPDERHLITGGENAGLFLFTASADTEPPQSQHAE